MQLPRPYSLDIRKLKAVLHKFPDGFQLLSLAQLMSGFPKNASMQSPQVLTPVVSVDAWFVKASC